MLLEIVDVATRAGWALGVQLLLARLLLAGVLLVAGRGASARRWRAAARVLRAHVYPALGTLVLAGLIAHLVPGLRLAVAPRLGLPLAAWLAGAAPATAGAVLLAVASRRELRGCRRLARALCWRGGLLLAGGAGACAVLAALAGGSRPAALALAAASAGLAGLLAAGSRKALPTGRAAAALWVAATAIGASLG